MEPNKVSSAGTLRVMGTIASFSQKVRRQWLTALQVAIVSGPVAFVFLGSQAALTTPVGPIWPMDIVLAIVYGLSLLAVAKGLSLAPLRGRIVWISVLMILPLWATMKLIGSETTNQSLREFHPFLVLTYSVVVWAVATSSSNRGKNWTFHLTLLALIMTAVRISAQLLVPGETQAGQLIQRLLPISGPHVDGLILACLSGVLVHRWLRRPALRNLAPLIGLALVSFLTLELGNRGAFLALVVASCVTGAIVSIGKLRTRYSKAKTAVSMGLAVGCVFAPLFVANNYSVEELAGGFSYVNERFTPLSDERVETRMSSGSAPSNPSGTDTQILDSSLDGPPGSGTVRARLNAWANLGSWLVADSNRLWLGVGFDTNYLYESGSAELLKAGSRPDDGNKWSHNYLLTIAATLGLPALALFLTVSIGAFFVLCRAYLRDKNPLYAMAISIISATSTASLFGVIFENPWGSVPIAWAIGIGLSGLEPRSANHLKAGRYQFERP